MSKQRTIFLTAASGNIGKSLVPLLLTQSPSPKLVLPTSKVSGLISSLPSLAKLNLEQNAVMEEGSIKDPVWLQSLLVTHQVDTVFLCLTGTDELFITMNCLDAITRVNTVKHVIYLSIIGDFTSEAGFVETLRTRGYPHLFAKVLIEQRLKHAEIPFDWTVLGPTVFFNNDIIQKTSILTNGYLSSPLLESAINRISVSHIALAARNVMYDDARTWNRKKVMLGTKQAHTGNEIKEIWSKAIGRPLQGYFGTQEGMEAFEQEFRKVVPTDSGKARARDLRLVYKFLMRYGIRIGANEYEEQVRLLDKEPDNYETVGQQNGSEVAEPMRCC